MNKGLKSYTKQLDLSVGGINTYTNLYSGDANFIFTLPILTTVGMAPISVGLIFNKQNEDEIGMFGKGMKLNYQKKLEYLDVTTINITNAVGTVDVYTLNEQTWKYENSETGLTINYADDFIISDQTGNKVVYEVNNSNLVFEYPTRIEMKSGEKIILSESSNYLYLHNEYGDYITMTKNTLGMVEEITWTKNNIEMLKAYLTYTNSYLTKVVVKKGEAVLSEYSMGYNSDVIILTDNLTKDISYYSMTNNHVENIYFGKINNDGLFIFIDRDGNKTKVIDELGNVVTYVFDNEGLLRFLKDDRGNIISYQYDINTKQLIAENPVVSTNNNENLYKDSNIRNKVISSMSYESVSETDEFYTSLVGSNVTRFSGGGKYSFDLSTYLYKNEVVTLVAWVKQKGGNSGWITLAANGTKPCTTYLNKQSMDNEYQPIVVGLKLEENVTSLSVYIQADTEIYLGNIEVFKKGFGVFYEYENLKLKKINRNGDINELSYNEAGEVISTTLASTKVVKMNRNEKGLVVNRTTEFGRVDEATYDEKNRVLEKVVSNRHGDKKFKQSNSYIEDTACITTDALGNQSAQIKDLYGNTTMLVNSLLQVLDYSHYENLALKSIGLRKESNDDAEYTYLQESQIEYDEQHQNLIKKLTLKNGTYFTYDYNEKDLLTSIKQGGMTLMSFLYDEYDNIVTIYRGERLESNIIYDNYNRVVEINITDNLGVTTKYSYVYNNLDLLQKIYKNDEFYKTYEYDKDSNLTVVTDSLGNKQTYLYENNVIYGEINNIDDKKMYRMFNPSLEGQDYFSIYSRLFDNGKYSIAPLDTSELKLYINPENTGNSTAMMEGRIEGDQTKEDVVVKDVSMPRVALDSNSVLVYNLNMRNTKGFFGFWINLKEFNTSDINIFEVRNNYGSSAERFEIFVSSSQKVGVKYYNSNGVITKTVTTGRKIYLNDWVYIGFDYLKEDNTNISLYINDEIHTMVMPKYTMELITCKIGGTANCEISGFVCGFNQALSEEEIRKYYKETKQIFTDYKQEDIAKNKSVVIYSDTLSNMYPLISNCHRLDGAIYYNGEVFPENNCSLEDFKYDKELGRNVFNVEGQELIFRNLDTSEMSISMYVKAKENDVNKKVLFEIKQDEDNKIGLFVDIDNRVKIYVGEKIYSTGIILPINTWTYVGFSYTQAISSGSLAEYEFNFNIVVGNNTYTIVCETDIEIGSGVAAIGRRYEDENLDIFNGKMANLYIIDCGSSLSEILAKKNYLDTLPVSVSGYDEFGRFIRKNIKKFTNDIIKNEVKYATTTNAENNITYELNKVKEEKIYLNNQTITRTYTTDSLGRVTSITDSVFGNKNYVYDDRGFLTYDNGVRMLYDSNGNIKSYGSNTFGYGLTNDRLLNVNGRTVTYDSLNNFMPLSINGMTLSWEQNRLKQVIRNNNTISFKYNEQGLRTEKTSTTTSNYYYDGDKLITEVNTNYRLDFLYDENDMLFGFIYNNTDKYYYVRDILQNILGIVDESGTLVVKYDCNAWGKPINGTNYNGIILDTTSNNIGSINPFRYKGYYYDDETQLFYCNSRYYSPELCRFIQPADVSALNTYSINGLNLYSFANNNPIGNIYSSINFGSGTINSKKPNILNGSVIGNNIYGNNYPDLSFLSTGFSFIENAFSTFAGAVDGYRKIEKLDNIPGLEKASNILMWIGIGLNVSLSAYESFLVNKSQSGPQKWGNFIGDVAYIAASSAITYGVGYLVGMIPYAGPFLAAPVSIFVGTLLDQIWSGEEVLWINGANISVKGKSLEEWFKDLLTEWFGG